MKYALDAISWEITLKCNLKCFHCEFSAGKAAEDELSLDESLKLCDDLKKINCKRIILMGGEPFLRKDWFEIAEKIKGLQIELAFISNGFINSKPLFKKLEELSPCFIGLSLDGGIAETHDKIRGVKGSFENVLNFIDTCIDLKIPVIVVTSVHKLNFNELPILRDVLYDKKLFWELQLTDVAGRFPKKYLLDQKEFYEMGEFIHKTQKEHPRGKEFINGAHDMGYHSEYLPDITGFKKWHSCQAGINIMAIESDGGVKGCSSLTHHFVEDNIRKRSIVDIWNDPNSFPYNRNFRLDDLKGFCKKCKYSRICKGGCIETSYMSTGELHCDPYCFYRIEQESK